MTWELLRVCAACPTPRLNLRFELRPSWNNIHDTSPPGPRRTQHKFLALALKLLDYCTEHFLEYDYAS
jgi:hypothetical protein